MTKCACWSYSSRLFLFLPSSVIVSLSGFMLTATVSRRIQSVSQKTRDNVNVSLVFERQNIMSSSCSKCRDSRIWCEHVIAALLYRMEHANDVSMKGFSY